MYETCHLNLLRLKQHKTIAVILLLTRCRKNNKNSGKTDERNVEWDQRLIQTYEKQRSKFNICLRSKCMLNESVLMHTTSTV